MNYGNDEDLARGLLILFKSFRNEMDEIHSQDVKQLLVDNRELIESKRQNFEKYKLMTELISKIESNVDANDNLFIDEDDGDELETTSEKDIQNFNNWAKTQANKELSNLKNLVDVRNETY